MKRSIQFVISLADFVLKALKNVFCLLSLYSEGLSRFCLCSSHWFELAVKKVMSHTSECSVVSIKSDDSCGVV